MGTLSPYPCQRDIVPVECSNGEHLQSSYFPIYSNVEKTYYHRLTMAAESEERDSAECIYIQLIHEMEEYPDE